MKRIACNPDLNTLKEFTDFSYQYNAAFEYVDFYAPPMLDDDIAIERAIKLYQDTGRNLSQDTLHGAFLDICVDSSDSLIFKASDYRVRQCMDIARKMGLQAVIFHTNYIANFRLSSYRNAWLDRNEEYWRQILQDYPELNIYMENMFDESPDLLAQLAKRLQDHPRFGVCLDIAHAHISGTPVECWYSQLPPYTKHLHINDNDGIQDLHWAVGAGTLDWQQFSRWCYSNGQTPTTLIEVRSFQSLQESVEFMQREHIYPFA